MAFTMGMNTGSSVDGIDVVLCEIEMDSDNQPKPPKFIKGSTYEWPENLEALVKKCYSLEITLPELARLDYSVGALLADRCRTFMKENDIDYHDVLALGVDGQVTYLEQPKHDIIDNMSPEEKDDWIGRWHNGPYPCGFWLGETSIISSLTNINTITHFRAADHVTGGNGGPLMQYFDYVLFRHQDDPVMTLNIGGIANAHLAQKDRSKMYAFDTGPGNTMLDYTAKKLFGKPYDKNGELSAKGKINEQIMAKLLSHPFFERPTPRSPWLTDFSFGYADKIFKEFPYVPAEDFLKTFACFTGEAIVKNMHDNVPEELLKQVKVMYASGGGVRNSTIMEHLQKILPFGIRLTTSDEIGIPAAYKECIKFATLAFASINCVADNIPAASHSEMYNILGRIHYAPWRAKGIF